MSDRPDRRIKIIRVQAEDILAMLNWKVNRPVYVRLPEFPDVPKDAVVTVYGVSVEVEPRSLLVKMKTETGERSIEIRESFLLKPTQ